MTISTETVVYLTSGIFGYLYRFFPVGRQLIEHGYRVEIVTASADAVNHARAEGFSVTHLARQAAAIESLPGAAWPAPLSRVASRIPGIGLGPRTAAKAHWAARSAALVDTGELETVLDELEPSLVVTEAEEHRDIRLVLALGLPLVLFEDLYSVRPGPDVTYPARSHQVPTDDRSSRVRAWARWQRFFATEAVRRRAERWWVDGHDWHSMLDQLGERAGLDVDQRRVADFRAGRLRRARPKPNGVSRRYFQYYDYLGVPRVRTIAPELAFPGERQVGEVVGPIVDVERRTHEVDDGFATRWAQVKERRREGARIIYVSLGTFLVGLDDLTQQVIDAASRIENTEVVVSVGRDIDRWRRAEVPDNVAVFGRVPQLEVLADADVAVATGGLNTGHEAMWFGVPMLNVPVAGIDTAGNSARFVYHGVGRQLVGKDISVDSLGDEITLLLTDSGYRDRAAAMSETLRRWNGIDRAVAAIENYLG